MRVLRELTLATICNSFYDFRAGQQIEIERTSFIAFCDENEVTNLLKKSDRKKE